LLPPQEEEELQGMFLFLFSSWSNQAVRSSTNNVHLKTTLLLVMTMMMRVAATQEHRPRC
jgi:hypothetical protein